MQTLTRQQIIEQLQAAATAPERLRTLPAWAWDQFYTHEDEQIAFETGYRAAIGSVLDDLMFGDDAAFALTNDDVARLIRALEQAQPATDDEFDEDEDDA